MKIRSFKSYFGRTIKLKNEEAYYAKEVFEAVEKYEKHLKEEIELAMNYTPCYYVKIVKLSNELVEALSDITAMSILNKQIDSDYVDGIKTLVDKSRHTLALIQASGAKTLSKPDVISSVCDHPQRQREYYRDKCYKCWECLKIVVEQTDL